ncbi:MAG: hypothetical protein PV345_05480 [Wolbachia sp.]|nr:hypothetical protein [Wolbachia sp.]
MSEANQHQLEINRIVEAGKKVYQGYLLLDIVSDKKTVILL